MKILIADDEIKLRSMFKTILSTEFPDNIIDMVADGQEAVDVFRKGYDILLLDLSMPVKSGCQAFLEIQEICSRENLKTPYVIFCTGLPIPEELEEIAGDTSHCAILQKPVTYEDLIETFKAVVKPNS
ncbi:MAG: response regulator [Kiritimatiellae bacterium]|nr:response regulator [Kiritimatiellia bacterium]MDD5519478.1 response regulator [Kiritimatiellia bacterium]